MKITIFGTGYVGLVQGAVLAEMGNNVICVDLDENKVAQLNQGHVPIYEPGLEELVIENSKAGRLEFTTDHTLGVNHGQIIFTAVGTPPDEDGSADLKHVLAVAKTIGEHMTERKVIVNKSTVPVGTADKVQISVAEALKARDEDIAFDVVSNPEFLKEGSAVHDCMSPDRIIIGTHSNYAEEVMRELYAPFERKHGKVMVMDVRSAELTKYAANCMLATKISFINEIANLSDRLGADIEAVRQGIGSDPRIGYQFIYPGAGYGGSCFPKDVQALIRTADDIGFDSLLLKAVEQRNAAQKQIVVQKILKHYGDVNGKTFALWGLAFKPNTDDIREAPARVVMEALWEAGAKVQAYDPEAMEQIQHAYGNSQSLRLCGTKESALHGADALIIMTEWQAFRSPDFDLIQKELTNPIVFDGRNLYDPSRMTAKGFTYYCIGRGER
ncbi:UDP-glucose/GDP-mannose dehydrogenase family protein [Gilvimarinus agarilyticus]|uniref:UDP-glucose dehydrogenase family protein n=1 Tax=unclassified Gilvimarinus TaxID=2642066 RepID=UPI001C09C466|nr:MULTISPECIES: UDP-glucose/GDP-mannose dehydrogenase family protein [unclassified Gilvimarinus]MBU2886605.1 UDP-glucose/GDP-mannose dehydrogenase family protein [Gilvimarinus agarilyticus]MDO6571273.1 UDP-glucose/GDP-mannose dehydrogenase family protein [Gilvimarinus sp. 2_MG-2023]MDO6746352.1 UDP-glucose/GDP-mannose dehydrogenase family protein [Gilvimarinus sp. 1_MG-2023]